MSGQQEKVEAVRCICGRRPCSVKHKGRYMITCPAQDKCAMRSRWKGSEQEAVKDWNVAVNAAQYQRGGKSWHRVKRQRNPVAGRSTLSARMAWTWWRAAYPAAATAPRS